MSSMHKCWSLFNKEDKLRIDELSSDQVRTILLAIPSSRMRDWFACGDGDVHWQALIDIPEFYEDVRELKGSSYVMEVKNTPPPLANKTERRPLFEESPVTGSQDLTLQVENVGTKERRTARRYNRKLLFRAAIGGQKFESHTIDISMSGLSLEQALPQEFGKKFRAEISLADKKMKVVCSKVGDNQLRILEAESWELLRQWIANW